MDWKLITVISATVTIRVSRPRAEWLYIYNGFADYITIYILRDLWDLEYLKISGNRRSERSKCFKEVKIYI